MTFRPARASPFSEITDESTLHRPNTTDQAASTDQPHRSFEYNHCQGYFQGYNQGREASYSFNPGNKNMQRQGSTMTNGYQCPSTEQHPAYWRPPSCYSSERPRKTRWPQPYPTNHRTSRANYEYIGYARGESPSMAKSEKTLPTSNMTTSYLHSHYKYGDYFSAGPSSSSRFRHSGRGPRLFRAGRNDRHCTRPNGKPRNLPAGWTLSSFYSSFFAEGGRNKNVFSECCRVECESFPLCSILNSNSFTYDDTSCDTSCVSV
jgi:hypothetical protein